MVRNIKQLLKDLGWADGFNIPVANEENKKLEEEVEKLILQKAEIIVEIENVNERLNNIKLILKKVIKEKERNQVLLNKLRQNHEKETLMLNQSTIQNKSSNSEIKDMKREISLTETNNKKTREQIQIFIVRINELKEYLNWGEDKLFAWEEDLAKEDKDFDFIEHYRHVDQQKYNELEHKRQMTQFELNEITELENRASDNLENLENHFFHLCRDFKKIEIERNDLLQLWHTTNKMIKASEKKTEVLTKEINLIKEEMRHKLINYISLEKAYNSAKEGNNFYISQWETLENKQCFFEEQVEKREKIQKNIEAEAEAIKAHMKQLDYETNLEKYKTNELKKSLEASKLKLKTLMEENMKLNDRLNSSEIQKMTADQKCRTAEDIYEMGKKMLKEESNEIKRIETMSGKLINELTELKEKVTFGKLELIELQKREDEIEKDKKLLEKQLKELYLTEYNLEMDFVDTTHKLNILEGLTMEVQEENKLKTLINQLQDEIFQKSKETSRLRIETRNLNKEVNLIQLDINQAENEINQLNLKIDESKCRINGGKRTYIKVQEQYNKQVLKLNLLKVQISFVEENKKKQGLSVSMLERQKLYLEAAMQERLMELKGHKEILFTQKKTFSEEKSFLKRSIDHLASKIKIIEKKYEIALDSLGKGDDGERISLTLFQLKMGQEKNELQDLGDELEARINKTEKEIQAMENTLRVISNTNENFKTNLEALDMESAEAKEYSEAENEYYYLEKHIEALKSELCQIQSETESTENRIKVLQQYGIQAQQEWKQKEKEVLGLTKDLATKQIKLERATKVLQKLVKEVKAKEQTTFKTLAMRDIEVRMEADRNRCVLQQLAEMAAMYLETSPIIAKYLTEKGLSIPQELETGQSFRASSTELRSSDAGSRLSAVSEISLTPSIVHLDPTVLLPPEYQRTVCRK